MADSSRIKVRRPRPTYKIKITEITPSIYWSQPTYLWKCNLCPELAVTNYSQVHVEHAAWVHLVEIHHANPDYLKFKLKKGK